MSRSTVSRVVNGSTAVRAAALEAVQRAIAERSYVPNRAARSLAGPLDMPAGIDRLQGWRVGLADAGLDAGPVEDGNFTADGGSDAMRRILDRGVVPDAIFVASDLMARGAIGALAGVGLRVPADVAIIGFDDSPVALTVTPRLTTMRQPSRDQGAVMTEVLLARLAGRHPPRVAIMDTELGVRDSAQLPVSGQAHKEPAAASHRGGDSHRGGRVRGGWSSGLR